MIGTLPGMASQQNRDSIASMAGKDKTCDGIKILFEARTHGMDHAISQKALRKLCATPALWRRQRQVHQRRGSVRAYTYE